MLMNNPFGSNFHNDASNKQPGNDLHNVGDKDAAAVEGNGGHQSASPNQVGNSPQLENSGFATSAGLDPQRSFRISDSNSFEEQRASADTATWSFPVNNETSAKPANFGENSDSLGKSPDEAYPVGYGDTSQTGSYDSRAGQFNSSGVAQNYPQPSQPLAPEAQQTSYSPNQGIEDAAGSYAGSAQTARSAGGNSIGASGQKDGRDDPTIASDGTQPSWLFPQGGDAESEGESSPKKKPRTLSMRAATAMALAAAIGAGSITGVVVSNVNNSDSSSRAAVVDSLNKQPVANTTGSEAKDGSVEKVAATVLPSVVSISVTTRTGVSEGSGSIISEDGYVLTNNHVISDATTGAAQITVSLNDGSEYNATVVAGDANTDVAVIKLEGASGLPVINFGDSSALQVGQEVVAVGSPLGLSATVTSGIVSALNRPVRAGGEATGQSSLIDAIQTDAAINPGNSGGPLVDMNGNLIGMNSVIASTSTSSGEAGSIGLGFAIPANFARRVASQLIETGQASQPMIGVQLQSNSAIVGALIADVTAGGPGEQAGLQAGEVITAMNGRRIDSADALIAAVRSSDFGETITLTVGDENGSNEREVEVTLTSE